jgi:hypothetical protein
MRLLDFSHSFTGIIFSIIPESPPEVDIYPRMRTEGRLGREIAFQR